MKKLLYILLLISPTTLVLAQEQTIQTDSIPLTDTRPLIENIKYNLYYDSRMDYKNTFYNDQKNHNNEFNLSTSRLTLNSSFNDKVELSMRYTLKKDASQSNGLEYAFLTVNLSEKWSVSAGKLILGWGTYEIDYNGADLYLYSIVMNSLEVYAPGVNFQYRWNKQKFNLQVVNPGSQFVEEDDKNNKLGYLFMWEGSLFNSKLKTRYGYALMQHKDNQYYNWITLGNRLDFKKGMIELDWMYGYHDLNLPMQSIQPSHLRDNVVGISSKYYFHKWNPFVRVVYNHRNDFSNGGKETIIGTQLAAEYYPFETPRMKNFRLFASYNYEASKFDNTMSLNAKTSKHEVLCGVRWLVPLASKN